MSPPPLTLTGWLRYDVLRRYLPPEGSRVLEVGAGLGSVGALLAERYDYVGVEPDPTSYAIARARIGTSGRLLNCTVEQLPGDDRFDTICAFEVLEHIRDERNALTAWLRRLRRDGVLLVSVPHGSRLGPQDRKIGHYRRYDRADLATLLTSVGLADVEVVTYGFPLGNVLEIARNGLARLEHVPSSREEATATSARWLQPPGWVGVGTRAASYPFRVAQRCFTGTNHGVGLFACARHRGADR